MMQKISLSLGLCSFFILASCSTLEVKMDYDNNVSFTGLHSYSWLPGRPLKSGDPKLDSNDLMHRRIRASIDGWLKNHGYAKQPREQADFLVSYYIVIEQKTRITVLNDYYGYPRGWGRYDYYDYPYRNQTYAYEYEEGTMIIDIVNNKTKKLMWRGTAVDEVKDLKTPEEKQARITEVVDSIMAGFPPK